MPFSSSAPDNLKPSPLNLRGVGSRSSLSLTSTRTLTNIVEADTETYDTYALMTLSGENTQRRPLQGAETVTITEEESPVSQQSDGTGRSLEVPTSLPCIVHGVSSSGLSRKHEDFLPLPSGNMLSVHAEGFPTHKKSGSTGTMTTTATAVTSATLAPNLKAEKRRTVEFLLPPPMPLALPLTSHSSSSSMKSGAVEEKDEGSRLEVEIVTETADDQGLAALEQEKYEIVNKRLKARPASMAAAAIAHPTMITFPEGGMKAWLTIFGGLVRCHHINSRWYRSILSATDSSSCSTPSAPYRHSASTNPITPLFRLPTNQLRISRGLGPCKYFSCLGWDSSAGSYSTRDTLGG